MILGFRTRKNSEHGREVLNLLFDCFLLALTRRMLPFIPIPDWLGLINLTQDKKEWLVANKWLHDFIIALNVWLKFSVINLDDP